MTITAEEVERQLRPARPLLSTAALAAGDGGHEQAAVALGALGGVEDKDDALAAFWVALEFAPPEDRDVVARRLYEVAALMREMDKPQTTLRLVEVCERLGTMYGLPGEDAA